MLNGIVMLILTADGASSKIDPRACSPPSASLRHPFHTLVILPATAAFALPQQMVVINRVLLALPQQYHDTTDTAATSGVSFVAT